MAETKKFTDEELKNITEIRDGNSRIISDLGQIELQTFLINDQLNELGKMKDALQEQFKNLQAKETELISQLNEKYGIGTVDINTGEFIPQN